MCRRSVQFSAAFLPGSSRDFRVTPSSGFLPPVGSAGKLISVSFTPTSANSKHTARLTIQVFTGFIIWSPRLCFDRLLDYLYGVDHNMPLLYISHGRGSFLWVLACLCSRQYWCSGPSRWEGQSYSLHPSVSHRTMATLTAHVQAKQSKAMLFRIFGFPTWLTPPHSDSANKEQRWAGPS